MATRAHRRAAARQSAIRVFVLSKPSTALRRRCIGAPLPQRPRVRPWGVWQPHESVLPLANASRGIAANLTRVFDGLPGLLFISFCVPSYTAIEHAQSLSPNLALPRGRSNASPSRPALVSVVSLLPHSGVEGRGCCDGSACVAGCGSGSNAAELNPSSLSAGSWRAGE